MCTRKQNAFSLEWSFQFQLIAPSFVTFMYRCQIQSHVQEEVGKSPCPRQHQLLRNQSHVYCQTCLIQSVSTSIAYVAVFLLLSWLSLALLVEIFFSRTFQTLKKLLLLTTYLGSNLPRVMSYFLSFLDLKFLLRYPVELSLSWCQDT